MNPPILKSSEIIEPALLSRFAAACQTAADLGGAVLMDQFGKARSWKKGIGDWVTQADFESQRVIQDYLKEQFPAHRFLGEEQSGSTETLSSSDDDLEYCWIVDPLDGTVNFVHQLRSFSVSVALRIRNPRTGFSQVVTGTVFDPTTQERFSATWQKGATLNGDPIRPSSCQQLADALTVISTNTSVGPDDPQVKRMLNVMATPASMRRLGSAALNLCYVACGRVDANWATNLSCWDIAAGWLIATEAGAELEDFDGAPLNLMRPKFCCASTRQLMNELRPLLMVNG